MGPAELFAVASAMGPDRAGAKVQGVTSADVSQGVGELVLAVLEQRGLRSAGSEGAAGGDRNLVLRAVHDGIEFGDRCGELELQADVIDQ